MTGICVFRLFTPRKKEDEHARFSERIVKKSTDKTEFLLEYHKASVKNKHRGMRAFRDKNALHEMHLQFNDRYLNSNATDQLTR